MCREHRERKSTMNEQDIKKLIHTREFQGMEWKASLSLKQEIGEAVSAFANTNDGVIFVGVSDGGCIVGVTIGKGTLEDLANHIKQSTDTKVYPTIKEHRIDGKDIIEVSVKEVSKKPVFFKGTAYQRVGRSSHFISSDRIAELMTSSEQIPKWDERACKGAYTEHIDIDKLRWFLEKTRSERGSDIAVDAPIEESLERLDLIQNGEMTNAAILLFGKNPQKFFRQATTKCGRFKGTEPIEFIDMKDFSGSIIDQRDNAVEFIMEHIKFNVKIVGAERVETWEYPIIAIREAITNAICHRDYEMSANIQVRIFDDRIEIWGCGVLPEPLTVEDLKRDHRSVLRNPLIANCLYKIGFIEQWGTGTTRILSTCRDHGLPEPLFEQQADGLIVTLRKITEEIIEGLSEEEKSIIDYLEENTKISRSECVALLKVSPKTAYRYLKLLKNKGLISRHGKGKGTHYVLVDVTRM